MSWNAHTGRQAALSDTALDAVDVTVEYADGDARFTALGNEVCYENAFDSPETLESAIEFFTYVFPVVLNVEFLDSPMVERTYGSVDDIGYGWELLSSGPMETDVTSSDIQEEKLARAWKRSMLFNDDENRRLIAALHYFHVACRLERAGHFPWEFLAEIVLNLAKVLEALFPPTAEQESMDAARSGLEHFGYSEDEIERDFVPALVLRSKLDVAHVSLAVFERGHLDVVHRYCEAAESSFRELLGRALDGVSDGTYEVEPYDDATPAADTVKSLNKIEALLAGEV